MRPCGSTTASRYLTGNKTVADKVAEAPEAVAETEVVSVEAEEAQIGGDMCDGDVT